MGDAPTQRCPCPFPLGWGHRQAVAWVHTPELGAAAGSAVPSPLPWTCLPKILPYGSQCWRAPRGSRDRRSSSTASGGLALPLGPGHSVALAASPLQAGLAPRPAGLEPMAGAGPQLRPAPLSPLLRTVMLLRFAFTLGQPRGVAARYKRGSSRPSEPAGAAHAEVGRGVSGGRRGAGKALPHSGTPCPGPCREGLGAAPTAHRAVLSQPLPPAPLALPTPAAPRNGCAPAPLLPGSNAAFPRAAPLPTDAGPGAPGAVHRPYGRPDCLPPEV